MMENENTEFKILIVDDNPKNIQVVGNLLSRHGYPTAFALNGEQAMEMVKNDRYDLILLDVMMPEMNGFQVCEALKNNDDSREIPVIFLTAKTDIDSITKGFDVGAYDYVTKPFIGKELLSRVRTQLHIKSLNDTLKKRYEEIMQLEIMRESLTSMIIHDLKNPLSGITGYAGLLQITPSVSADSRASDYVQSILNCSRNMLDMIMAMLDVAKMESGKLKLNFQLVEIPKILSCVVDGIDPLLLNAGVDLSVHLAPDIPKWKTDQEILRRIIVNIISNAIHFSPKNSVIKFSAVILNKNLHIAIADQGPGIPEAFKEQIFDKYKQVNMRGSNRKYSTGLGLTFCKMAVEHLSGTIRVDSEVGKGSIFRIILPTIP